ncbi:hypothetical protein C8R44DRAFT_752914 [Mycena epipterygia]|nr:hypothetical protein C8R44DRAFT_752914 [Mycena epipterygia]
MCLRILTWVDRVVEATSTNVDTHLATCVYVFLREVAGLRLRSATFGYTHLRHRSPEVDQNVIKLSASTWGWNTVNEESRKGRAASRGLSDEGVAPNANPTPSRSRR